MVRKWSGVEACSGQDWKLDFVSTVVRIGSLTMKAQWSELEV